MDRNEKMSNFLNEFDLIKNEDLKELAIKMISENEDRFFLEGASSTGKYHPVYAQGTGGLVRHTRAAVYFLNLLMDADPKFCNDEHARDLLTVAILVHDIKKYGIDGSSRYTVAEHPSLAAEYLQKMIYDGRKSGKFKSISDKDIVYMCSAIESHMGKWGEKDGLPVPTLPHEVIVHTADFLASRKDIDVKIFSQEDPQSTNRNINEDSKPVTTNKFYFGKFKDMTFDEIYKIEPSYLEWYARAGQNEYIAECVKNFLKTKQNAQNRSK